MQISKRAAFLLFSDIAATFLAYFLASLLTDLVGDVFSSNEIYFALGILALINIGALMAFRLYNILWEYASVSEALQILLAVVLGTLLGAVVLWIVGVRLPIRVFFVACILLIFFMGGTRLAFRYVRRRRRASSGGHPVKRPRTLIVGAGESGSLTIDRMLSKDPLMPGVPLVLVDDAPGKHSKRIHGIKVEGTSDNIIELVDKHDIEQIVVAIPSSTIEERKRIYGICTQTHCKLQTLPNIRDLRIDELGDVALRDVDVADLLGREEVMLNTRIVSRYVADEVILVTGGGGTIGSELCRQLCKAAPRRIIAFDISENEPYLLKYELERDYSDIEIAIEIGSVCDEARLSDVFKRHKPTVVFHAAAHKHVSLMEDCPREAIKNNVFGTLNTVRLAHQHAVERFIFISTDKAVSPTSVMGATKRMGEIIVQYYASISTTVFSAVRFGNVLGSNGSVIPVFQRQIAAGGPVTITHPDIERYFMTIPEAVRLVIQAGGMARGGEIFILDMGEPVKILDLAKSLIRLSGHTAEVDIAIKIIGLRTGEKMYEELLTSAEDSLETSHPSIMVAVSETVGADEVAQKISELGAALSGTDEEAILVLESAVPGYCHTAN